MNFYEQTQLAEIQKWETQVPNVLSRLAGFAFKPAGWLVGKVVPPKAIEGALTACYGMAGVMTDKNDIMRDGGVSEISELKTKDLQLSDKLANEVHNWANGAATVEGGIAGVAGLPGLAVDIPALITMGFRVVQKIGLCYGYECVNDADRQFVLQIFSAASANTMEEKTLAIVALQRINVAIAKKAWKKMAENAARNAIGIDAGIIAVKALAKKLGINITRRKALQSIPYIGAGVGAATNLSFINDIAWAARRSFQKRWLIDNKKIEVKETNG